MRLLPLALLAASLFMLATGCGSDNREVISISADPETFPTMRTTNVSTMISDSGYTRYHITTPLWLMFEEAKEPHWNFPDGMFIVQFNDSMQESGTFTADTGTYFSAKSYGSSTAMCVCATSTATASSHNSSSGTRTRKNLLRLIYPYRAGRPYNRRLRVHLQREHDILHNPPSVRHLPHRRFRVG